MSGDVGASLFTSFNTSEAYDPADNGLSAIPEFERWTFNPQLFFEGESSELRLGVSAVVEDRLGGGIDFIEGRRDVPAYYEDSSTERLSTQLEYVTQLDSGNEFVLRNSVNHFERELDVPGFSFSGTQISSFSEAHIVGASGALDWVAGFNIWTEDFDQDAVFSGSSLDFNSQTEGAFAQGTYLLTDRWIIEGGLRIDHTSDYGSFILPRASLLYKPASDTTIRIGGGLGYKKPTPFTEEAESIQYRGVLPLDISNLDAEQSVGMNFDINKSLEIGSNLSLNLNLLLFYTRVADPLRLIQIDTDQFAFRQPNDTLDSRGTEINAVFRWDDFKIFLGYTHADVEENTIGGVESAPLVPKDRLNSVFVYEREDDIRIGLEAYYYGRQELTSGAKSRDYWIFGLMIEKIFSDKFSLFINFENFTDTRQTRYGSINSGTLASPIFADIFAPLDGYVANGGIKLRF
jgi:outer membrane receptor for ferrienterochelin and colicins